MTGSSIANARFQLLDRPLIAPGKCAVCGTTERAVVDFGAYVDWFGAIYLCVSCLTEAAATIGMVSSEEHAKAVGSASQSFSSYLIEHNLMVVSSEWYQRAADLFGGIPVSDAYIRVFADDEDSAQLGAEVPSESAPHDRNDADSEPIESGDILGNDAPSGQDGDTTIDSGPTSISASTGNESDGLGTILSL